MFNTFSFVTFLNDKTIQINTEHLKRYILSLVVIFLVLLKAEVRAQQRGSLWFNVISGVNSTWIVNQNAYGNQEIEYSAAFGLTGGVGVSYFHNRDWGFTGSFLASQLGQNYKGYQAGAVAQRKIKLMYLECPLMVMKGIRGTQYPTWISFGPDIMILLNAKQDYVRDGGSPLPNPEGMVVKDTKERFNQTDVAMNFALNRMYAFNYSRKMMILISLNSAIGFTDINKSAWQIANTHDHYGKSRNFYIGAKIGIMYNVKRLRIRYW
jgi:hypothetical protein